MYWIMYKCPDLNSYSLKCLLPLEGVHRPISLWSTPPPEIDSNWSLPRWMPDTKGIFKSPWKIWLIKPTWLKFRNSKEIGIIFFFLAGIIYESNSREELNSGDQKLG